MKQAASRIGHELYTRFRERGDTFKFADFAAALEASSEMQALGSQLYAIAVEDVAERVDRHETRSNQRGETRSLFDLDGTYALGDGGRIAKQHASIKQMQEVLAIHDANLRSNMGANLAVHEEFERLKPFWGPGLTKGEASKAYLAANGGEGPSGTAIEEDE